MPPNNKNAHGHKTYGSQKTETAPMPVNCPADRQIVVYPHNKILFGHEKEWGRDTYYSKLES